MFMLKTANLKITLQLTAAQYILSTPTLPQPVQISQTNSKIAAAQYIQTTAIFP